MPTTTDEVKAEFESRDLPGVVLEEQITGERWYLRGLPGVIWFHPTTGYWHAEWRDEIDFENFQLGTVVQYISQHIEREFEALRAAKNVRVLHGR